MPDEAEGAALEREEDSSAAERPAVGDGGGDVVETVERESPAAAVPKVSQSIWDTSSCVSVDAAELRFMPFSMVVDLSKLAELATLAGHSSYVWHGVFSCFSLCVCDLPWLLGHERRRLPRRPARRLRVVRQHGQGVGLLR